MAYYTTLDQSQLFRDIGWPNIAHDLRARNKNNNGYGAHEWGIIHCRLADKQTLNNGVANRENNVQTLQVQRACSILRVRNHCGNERIKSQWCVCMCVSMQTSLQERSMWHLRFDEERICRCTQAFVWLRKQTLKHERNRCSACHVYECTRECVWCACAWIHAYVCLIRVCVQQCVYNGTLQRPEESWSACVNTHILAWNYPNIRHIQHSFHHWSDYASPFAATITVQN